MEANTKTHTETYIGKQRLNAAAIILSACRLTFAANG